MIADIYIIWENNGTEDRVLSDCFRYEEDALAHIKFLNEKNSLINKITDNWACHLLQSYDLFDKDLGALSRLSDEEYIQACREKEQKIREIQNDRWLYVRKNYGAEMSEYRVDDTDLNKGHRCVTYHIQGISLAK